LIREGSNLGENGTQNRGENLDLGEVHELGLGRCCS